MANVNNVLWQAMYDKVGEIEKYAENANNVPMIFGNVRIQWNELFDVFVSPQLCDKDYVWFMDIEYRDTHNLYQHKRFTFTEYMTYEQYLKNQRDREEYEEIEITQEDYHDWMYGI